MSKGTRTDARYTGRYRRYEVESTLNSRPQEHRLNTGSRLCRAMLAPAAAPPSHPGAIPQAEKTD